MDLFQVVKALNSGCTALLICSRHCATSAFLDFSNNGALGIHQVAKDSSS